MTFQTSIIVPTKRLQSRLNKQTHILHPKPRTATLSRIELRQIVAEMLG